jgi:hypothetical protein
MVQMVLRLAALAAHQPETSIRVVIAVEYRLQCVGSAGRTGKLVELDAYRPHQVVLHCHALPPSQTALIISWYNPRGVGYSSESCRYELWQR